MPVSTIARHVAEAVNSLLDHPDRKQALELSSYAYAKRHVMAEDRGAVAGAHAPGSRSRAQRA